MKGRSGLALLVVAGVLGLLAVLATAFGTMAGLERRASIQRLHATRAVLLARSGLEDAVARLSLDQAASYGGEDWDGLPGLSPFEAQQEILQPGVLNKEDCPARQALRPSFFARLSPGNPDPALLPVEGRRRGYSGRLSPDGAYALKALPEDGIHVNGGDLSSAGEHANTYDATLKRILGSLAQALGGPLTQMDGEALVTARPAGGWRDLEQVRQLLGWSAPKAEAFRPYLAFRAWVDRKVIRPNLTLSASAPATGFTGASSASAWAELRVGKRDPILPPVTTTNPLPGTNGVGPLWSGERPLNPHTDSYAPDFERDSLGRIVGRAPVNLNWAKSRPPVIAALLNGLQGVYLDSTSPYFVGAPISPVSKEDQGVQGIRRTASLSFTFTTGMAASNPFLDHQGFPTWATEYPDWDKTASFDSWDEFNRFVDLKLAFLSEPQRDLVKSNFNPNTDLNKFNPGETFYRHVDKEDLLAYSTEFCFRTPLHALSCAGRVTDAQGRLLAERTVSASARFEQLRLTTQSEFCAGNLGRPDIAGDETDFRLPGDPGFLAPTGSLDTTWGSRLLPGTQGFALQTYPESQWPGAPCPPPAVYDGNLQLASTETRIPGMAGLTFLASFDRGFDAEFAAGSPACVPDVDLAPPNRPLLGKGATGAHALVGTLHPDGCYSETRRAPGYAAPANLGNGLQGIASFWVKPSTGPDYTSANIWCRLQHHLCLQVPDSFPGTGNTQVLLSGIRRWGMQGHLRWGALIENRTTNDDIAIEEGPTFGWQNQMNHKTFWHAHRWHLVTFQWNLRAATSATFCNLRLNNTSHLIPGASQYYSAYGPPDGSPLLSNAQISLTRNCYREDGTFGPPNFYLGLRGPNPDSMIGLAGSPGGAADATLDEFLFCTRSTSMTETDLLASDRFPAGRYCKEDESSNPSVPEYLSCPLPLPSGTALLRADWTLIRPRPHAAPPVAPDLWPDPNRVFYGTGTSQTAGGTADARLRLLDPSGAALADLAGAAGGRLALQPAGPVRLGLDLRPRLDDNTGAWSKLTAPLLESPVLDDVTLTYAPEGGPALEAWRVE